MRLSRNLAPVALLPVAAVLSLAACKDPASSDGKTPLPADSGDVGPSPYDVEIGPYDATVRWTAYGIPHIEAADYGSLGFGVGQAQARHHGCAIADQIVMARSERARFFGPAYVDEDFSMKAQGVFEAAEGGFLELEPPIRDMLVGYAAGYNQWLADTPEARIPEECRGAEWLRPITHIDLLAYYVALGELASGAAFKDEIGQAQPPGAARQAPVPPASRLEEILRRDTMGSNGWAIGSERSASGGGMLLSNTHYPWFGNRRWFEMHVTIPGQVDFYGVSLAGILFPVMGFNRDVAWTHTVAASMHFNLNILELEPGNPTRYRYDGGFVDMASRDYEIEVLQPDGSVTTQTRTLYRSHHGPMLNAPLLGWTTATGVSMSDANERNLAMLPTWFGMVTADSIEALQDAQWTRRGIPWVNTIATDTAGNAWYADTTRVPGWTEAAEDRWRELVDTVPFIGVMAQYGVFGGDGGDPLFDWTQVKPPDAAPRLARADYVANANDSHWLNHAEETLEGYSLFYGPEGSPRTGRTRMNLRYLAELGEGSASGADSLFDLDEMEAAALGGRSPHAEDLLDAVVERCTGLPTARLASADVDITDSCAALAGWSGTYDLDARGALVFRELLGAGSLSYEDLDDAGLLYATPFDPADPVWTPAGLAAPAADLSTDRVMVALAEGTLALQQAGVALDARLGDVQYQLKDGEQFGVPGGGYTDGTIAVVAWSGGNDTLIRSPSRPSEVNSKTDLANGGYAINYGNSWVMALAYTPQGPEARAILTYSQSADPASPHYTDQSQRLADGQGMRPILFEQDDILADPDLVEESLHLDAQ